MLEPHIAPPACVTEDAFAALMEISKRPPVVFVEGRGSWLTDQEGKKYLDFIQGWAVNCLGHCPTTIVSAIKSQAEQLLNCELSGIIEASRAMKKRVRGRAARPLDGRTLAMIFDKPSTRTRVSFDVAKDRNNV
jgi:acetylornithine/succinyldiaminopimelate/putrescine aminotransferase